MKQFNILEPEQLRRTSRYAAVATAVGGLIVFTAIGYSMWQIHSLETAVAEKKEMIRQAEVAIDDKHSELEKLEREVRGLEKQRDLLTQEVKAEKLQTDVARSYRAALLLSNVAQDLKWSDDHKQQAAIVQLALKPTASAQRLSKQNSAGRHLYDFTLSLEFPKDQHLADSLKKAIANVSYHFNHPALTIKDKSSENPADGYAVHYQSWGTLHNVIITVALKDGMKASIDFDMSTVLPDIPVRDPKSHVDPN